MKPVKLVVIMWAAALALLGLLWLSAAPGFFFGLFVGIPVGATAVWVGQRLGRAPSAFERIEPGPDSRHHEGLADADQLQLP